ncbi:ACINU-like protein [Mya arenaria]|uniref:ACINU-like protein n=1 Tax=Mya arenaria TaxID=6604 RepID=A0ABY7EWQ3_MYAAR|nr:ACINU-like protein [Mya arenaria]
MADEEELFVNGKPLSSLRVVDLKKECDKRGLSKSGSKSHLVERLKTQLLFENPDNETSGTGAGPNKMLEKEDCQNEFIKQYLAQQKQLIENAESSLNSSSQESDSEESPKKRKADSPQIQSPPLEVSPEKPVPVAINKPADDAPTEISEATSKTLQGGSPVQDKSPEDPASNGVKDTPQAVIEGEISTEQSPAMGRGRRKLTRLEPAAESEEKEAAEADRPHERRSSRRSRSSHSEHDEPAGAEPPLEISQPQSEAVKLTEKPKEEPEKATEPVVEETKGNSQKEVEKEEPVAAANSADLEKDTKTKGKDGAKKETVKEMGTEKEEATSETAKSVEQEKDVRGSGKGRKESDTEVEKTETVKEMDQGKDEEPMETAKPVEQEIDHSDKMKGKDGTETEEMKKEDKDDKKKEETGKEESKDEAETIAKKTEPVAMETEPVAIETEPETKTQELVQEKSDTSDEVQKSKEPTTTKEVKVTGQRSRSASPEEKMDTVPTADEKAEKKVEEKSTPGESADAEMKETKESTDSKVQPEAKEIKVTKKISLNRRPLDDEGGEEKPEAVEEKPAVKKRKWGSRSATSLSQPKPRKATSISISTDSLKELIPEIKQATLKLAPEPIMDDEMDYEDDTTAEQAVVDPPSMEQPDSTELEEKQKKQDTRAVIIQRTITQDVTKSTKAKKDESGSEESGQESEDDDDEEEGDVEKKEGEEEPEEKGGSSEEEMVEECDEEPKREVKPRPEAKEEGDEAKSEQKVKVAQAAKPVKKTKKEKRDRNKEIKVIRRLESGGLALIKADEPERVGRSPSPARNPVSRIVHVRNLVRPFTLNQLKELLGRTGTFGPSDFWIDKIKSHCFVTYETDDEAAATRQALHNTKWPQSNPKTLLVDFASQEQLNYYLGGMKPIPPAEKKPAAKPDVRRESARERERAERETERQREREKRLKEREEREKARKPVREWDRDKKTREDWDPALQKSRSRSPREVKKEEEPPARLLDDLFKKTKATPCIYWLPLTEPQIQAREKAGYIRPKLRQRSVNGESREKTISATKTASRVKPRRQKKTTMSYWVTWENDYSWKIVQLTILFLWSFIYLIIIRRKMFLLLEVRRKATFLYKKENLVRITVFV